MAQDDDFELWLGGSRSHAASERPMLHRVTKAANLAGGLKTSTARARRFDGSRIGRGASMGRVLSSRDRTIGGRSRRVIVKARFVKLAGKGASAAVAHMRYLQRDGTTRDGERGALYGPDSDAADGKAFLAKGGGDRHQFRFIVAPEDGAEYEDLKPLTRRLMTQIEQDLGTRLDWVAVNHFNTGHPHSHILVRGIDGRGKDLIIAREYLSHGLRGRAAELVNLDLGPRIDVEIARANRREISQERFTSIDRRLITAIEPDGLVAPSHRDPVEQSLRAGRLKTLGDMGLASEQKRGRWQLDAALEPTLRAMGRRGDIIATLHHEMHAARPGVSPQDYAIHDPADGTAKPIIGRVVAHGLADDHADSHYLIVDATDGRSHYVGIGQASGEDVTPIDGIARITARAATIREVDRNIAAVAARNGGRYTIDSHLRHDPSASEAFAETHVRRLEAMRRATGAVDRQPDGSWIIAPEHLARAEAYERQLSQRTPVIIETLSHRPLEALAAHDGQTWLDRELTSPSPTPLEGGFGGEVRGALNRRQQWLIEQGLMETDAKGVTYRANMLAVLQQREFRRVAGQLSDQLGLSFAPTGSGEHIEGVYRRPVEAMAAGLPVIGTHWGGLKDTIGDGVTGFCVATTLTDRGVAYDQRQALATAVKLAGDPTLRRSMATASVRRAERLYSMTRFGRALDGAIGMLRDPNRTPIRQKHRWTPLGKRLVDGYSRQVSTGALGAQSIPPTADRLSRHPILLELMAHYATPGSRSGDDFILPNELWDDDPAFDL